MSMDRRGSQVGRTVSSGIHSNELTWLDACKNRKKLRNQRTKSFDAVILRDEQDDGDRHFGQVLLELEVPFARDQHFEARARSAKQFAVLQTCPALLLHGLNLVSGNLQRKFPRRGFVKQNAHRARRPLGPAPERPPLVRALRKGTPRGIPRGCLLPRDSRIESSPGPSFRRTQEFPQGSRGPYGRPVSIQPLRRRVGQPHHNAAAPEMPEPWVRLQEGPSLARSEPAFHSARRRCHAPAKVPPRVSVP